MERLPTERLPTERLRQLESMIFRDTRLAFVSSPSPRYYVPGDNPWPFLGALALFLTLSGAVTLVLGSHGVGALLLGLGMASLLAVVAGWFISALGTADAAGFGLAVHRPFRLGVLAFLSTEILLFGVCWYGLASTRELLVAHALTQGPLTLLLSAVSLLLSSAAAVVALTYLQRARARRSFGRLRMNGLSLSLATSIVFGVVFLAMQAPQYGHAMGLLGLGTTTPHQSLELLCLSVHGAHVVLGLVLLGSLWVHSLKNHLTATQHFGLTATAWYWHFLDVSWVVLLLLTWQS